MNRDRWLIFGILIIISLPFLGLVGFYAYGAPIRALNKWNNTAVARLELAKSNPPDGVSPCEWGEIVTITQSALVNCFAYPDKIRDPTAFRRFQSDFFENLPSAHINQAKISWIWDRIESLSIDGVIYSSEYRPVLSIEFGQQEP